MNNGNGKVPKWVLMMVVGMVLALVSMLWVNTISGLSTTDQELKIKVDVIRESSARLDVNIAEINGRLANIERALKIDGFSKSSK